MLPEVVYKFPAPPPARHAMFSTAYPYMPSSEKRVYLTYIRDRIIYAITYFDMWQEHESRVNAKIEHALQRKKGVADLQERENVTRELYPDGKPFFPPPNTRYSPPLYEHEGDIGMSIRHEDVRHEVEELETKIIPFLVMRYETQLEALKLNFNYDPFELIH